MIQDLNQRSLSWLTQDRLEIVKRLSIALQKLTQSSSLYLGSDCACHAYLAQKILTENGIECRVAIGAAAWRVGPNDGDVISHIPSRENILFKADTKAIPYHAWVETDSFIIDFSTHTLRLKASQLDALDGGHTTVEWNPEFLLLTKEEVKTYREVAQAPQGGVAFYQEIPALLEFMKSKGFTDESDPEDLENLRFIYSNPEVHIMGINNIDVQVA
jgi:hypothetical protein